MTREDVNGKYLCVGYQKRPQVSSPDEQFLTQFTIEDPWEERG